MTRLKRYILIIHTFLTLKIFPLEDPDRVLEIFIINKNIFLCLSL
jgi:hypothetical protein